MPLKPEDRSLKTKKQAEKYKDKKEKPTSKPAKQAVNSKQEIAEKKLKTAPVAAKTVNKKTKTKPTPNVKKADGVVSALEKQAVIVKKEDIAIEQNASINNGATENDERAAFMASLRQTSQIVIEDLQEELKKAETEKSVLEITPKTQVKKDEKKKIEEISNAFKTEKLDAAAIAVRMANEENEKRIDRKKAKISRAPREKGEISIGVSKVLDAIGRTAIGKFIGENLYLLGFYAECKILQICGFLREAAFFIAQMLAFVFARLWKMIASLFKNIWIDLISPFTRFKENVENLRKEADEGDGPAKKSIKYLGRGAKYYLGFIANIVSYILPLVAAGVFAFTVHSLLSKPYLLAVNVNGTIVGYVSDELALEDAKNMMRARVRLAPNQSINEWAVTPVYAIASNQNITTKMQLVDNILLSMVDDPKGLVPAVGIHLDGEIFGVTTEGGKLESFLKTRIEDGVNPDYPNAPVVFVRDVAVEDENEQPLYLVSGVMVFEDLLEALSVVEPEITYIVKEEDTLLSIAAEKGITVELLRLRNPEFAEENDEFVPQIGTKLLIYREKPFLQTKSLVEVELEESIPFEVEYEKVSSRVKGSEYNVQKGQPGIQMATYDYEYIDGELVSRIPRDGAVRVIQEPIKSIIQVGTYEQPIGEINGSFASAYIWPLPGMTGVSRGMGPVHRGLDITAPAGTPIYAANQGVVAEAGYHFSWGNYVLISHPDGLNTRYAHCTSLAVNAGDVVGQNQVVGYVGSTGYSSGNHLHFETILSGAYLDPYGYVSRP